MIYPATGPSLVGWRPSWLEAIALRLEATSRLEAAASRLEDWRSARVLSWSVPPFQALFNLGDEEAHNPLHSMVFSSPIDGSWAKADVRWENLLQHSRQGSHFWHLGSFCQHKGLAGGTKKHCAGDRELTRAGDRQWQWPVRFESDNPWWFRFIWCVLLLGARTLLGTKGIATRSKNATRNKGHRY